ncbi:MAG TPA: 4-aminobutyrate--2-oxoglutarate transaminase, partial [Acinetobacter radioresistens]|nr:4-aminobutyrate--2-oxoglutarate transaminase [Acinetobacter radioresistens]
MSQGLLLLTCGKSANVIRFLYPLTIPAEQFQKALDILKAGFTAVTQQNLERSA